MSKQKVELDDCLVISQTEKAIQVEIGDGPKTGEIVWIPQSQIDDDSEIWKKGDCGKLVISEWIANEKGLI